MFPYRSGWTGSIDPARLSLLLGVPAGLLVGLAGGDPLWPLVGLFAVGLAWLALSRAFPDARDHRIVLDEPARDKPAREKPAAPPPPQPDEEMLAAGPLPSPDEETRSPQAKKALLILVVEDNSISQQVLTMLLGKAGHRVEVAGNGHEALLALERDKFDLVFMDLHMPEMDGLRATRLLRAREKAFGGRVPVVAVTANALPGDRQRCLAAGMDDYLSKPIRRAALFEVIARLAGPGTAQGAVPADPSAKAAAVPDWLSLLRSLKLGDQDVRRLVRTFLESVPERMGALRAAVGTGDAAQVRDVAHSLKGTLAIFSSSAAGLARGLEELGTARQLDKGPALLAELEGSVRGLLETMGAFLQSPT